MGIGTTAPEAPLHVAEGSAGTVTASGNSAAVFERSGTAYVSVLTPANSESGIIFGNPLSSVDGGILFNVSTTPHGLQFRTGTNSTKMVIEAGGNVGIGTAAPAGKLHVAGTAGNNTGVWSNFSDRRLKNQIEAMQAGSLDRLLRLRGVTFEYARPELSEGYEGIHRGWIAQEVEEVFPEWVSAAPDGMKLVTPVGFNALTVEALRELRAEKDASLQALNQRLTEELKRRDAEIAELKQRVQRLEALLTGQR